MALPIVRTIFSAREILLRSEPDPTSHPRGLLALTRSIGWDVLAEVPGREIVMSVWGRIYHCRLVALMGIPASAMAQKANLSGSWKIDAEASGMPATGRALNVGDIRQVDPNIHAGLKYTRRLMDEYLGDEPLDPLNKGFFTLASYNAGPSRIRQLRREAARRGFDPNQWFGNVEEIVSERIGRETVNYVSNINKYYIAYRLVSEESERRAAERAKLKRGPG